MYYKVHAGVPVDNSLKHSKYMPQLSNGIATTSPTT